MKTRLKPAAARHTPQRDAGKSQEAILLAAAHEFASKGLAGARTDAIARSARVNKALIHYYFKDKESLYDAVLEGVFSRLSARMQQVLARDLPPGEKVLAFAGAHFDFIAASPVYPRLVQREMMRDRHSPRLRRIVQRYLRPLQQAMMQTLRQGMESGELRRLNPQHFMLSLVAMNVFYFSSALFVGLLSGRDPLAPASVAERRAAVLDVISAAVSPRQTEGTQRKERS